MPKGLSDNIRSDIRRVIEQNTGIVGQAMAARRAQERKQEQIRDELESVYQVTFAIERQGIALKRLEFLFTNISKDFQAITQSFGVSAVLQEETNKEMAAAVAVTEKPKTTEQIIPQALHKGEEAGDDNRSIWDDISGLLDMLDRASKKTNRIPTKKERAKRAGKKAREAAKKKGLSKKEIAKAGKEAEKKALQRAEKAAQQKAAKEASKAATKATIKAAAKRTLGKSLAKATAKSIPFLGAAVGVGFAVGRLIQGDVVGAGVEAVSGLGSAVTAIPATIAQAIRDIYFETYGVYPEGDPKNGERFGEVKQIVTETAEEILGKKVTPEPEKKPPAAATLAIPKQSPTLPVGPPLQPVPALPTVAATPVSGSPMAASSVSKTGVKTLVDLSSSDLAIMAMIKKHEGVRNKPYQDTKGLWTVGVGHLIGDGKTLPPEWNKTFTDQEIDSIFSLDYRHHKELAMKAPGWDKANEKGQAALIDLTFNMGFGWTNKFKKGVQALSVGDFKTAADEFIDSAWFKQVGGRAITVTGLIREGAKSGGTAVAQRPTTGVQVGTASTEVNAMKPKQQNNVTVVSINETNTVRKGMLAPSPKQAVPQVGVAG